MARLPREAARPGNPDFDGIAASTERLLGALLHSLQCCAKAQPVEGQRQPEQEVSHRPARARKRRSRRTATQPAEGTDRAAARAGVTLSQQEAVSALESLVVCAGMHSLHPAFTLCWRWRPLVRSRLPHALT